MSFAFASNTQWKKTKKKTLLAFQRKTFLFFYFLGPVMQHSVIQASQIVSDTTKTICVQFALWCLARSTTTRTLQQFHIWRRWRTTLCEFCPDTRSKVISCLKAERYAEFTSLRTTFASGLSVNSSGMITFRSLPIFVRKNFIGSVNSITQLWKSGVCDVTKGTTHLQG